ncbi:MAG: hypothetical protein KGL39_33935 [Patescibacteria group bacterium]|nr:hypothetical protein [Patescibacteria group bacterium]
MPQGKIGGDIHLFLSVLLKKPSLKGGTMEDWVLFMGFMALVIVVSILIDLLLMWLVRKSERR